MKKSKIVTSLIGLVVIGNSFAINVNPFQRSLQAKEGGGVHGGGGDVVTEKRIKDIRDNLLDFIQRGGHKGLDFKGRLTLADYESGNAAKDIYGMKLVLQEGAVTVNAIREKDEDLSDELKNTRVDGARKICKGVFAAKKDGLPYLICDVDAFAKMDVNTEVNADLQTVQIAHEYHSLAGIEQNVGSNSQYWLSTQLRAHMGYERVRRLVVGRGSVGIQNDYVNMARALFEMPSKAAFSDIEFPSWKKGDCTGVFLSAPTYTGGGGLDGRQIWDSFPAEISFEAKLMTNEFYRVISSPNLPYTGPGRYMSDAIKIASRDQLTTKFAETYAFTVKLVDRDTIVMEASDEVDGLLGKQIAKSAGKSVLGEDRTPFAYFVCKH